MVSYAKDLFRHGGRDETFGRKMRMISMRLKCVDFRRVKLRVLTEIVTRPRMPRAGQISTVHGVVFEIFCPRPAVRLRRAPTAYWQLALLAGRREQIAAAADGADDRGLGRIDLDFAPDPH